MAQGQFYFAYVDESVVFNAAVHNVWDENVFSFRYLHGEGDFAQIEFDIKNPRVGLLKTGRKRWVWFSYEKAGGVIVPIFYGRIVGLPSNIFEELVTVTYTARPVDYVAQKAALAASLRVAPFWDPLFIAADKLGDPDVVLEGYSKHWHIDPITHVVTVSDVITGEDGTVEFTEDQYLSDNMGLTLNQSPATTARVTATVSWENFANSRNTGAIDLAGAIRSGFTGNPPEGFFAGSVESFTFKGLQEDWPKPLQQIAGGYTVREDAELKDISFLIHDPMIVPPWFQTQEIPGPVPYGSLIFQPRINNPFNFSDDGESYLPEVVLAQRGYGTPVLAVHWEASRNYTETIVINLQTATQPIVTEPGDDEVIEINLNANKASDLVDGEVPIGDLSRRHFFLQERGKNAIKHLLCIARASLIIKSRAVEIEFQLPFESSLGVLTLRKNVLVHNPRLPGGEATGKIISIGYSLDGEDGGLLATVRMACAIGYGGAYTSDVGDPVYGSTDYMGADYQQFTNVVDLIDPTVTDLQFTVDNYEANDDGIDIGNLKVWQDIIESVVVTNQASEQFETLGPLQRDVTDSAHLTTILEGIPTTISLEFKNLNTGPFETEITITVSDLIIPAQINLEAA